MAKKQEKIDWVLRWLAIPGNVEASCLNQRFHHEFHNEFGGTFTPKNWGAQPVAVAMQILRQLAKEKKVIVRRVPLGCAWQPGFPKSCLSYALSERQETVV